MPLARIGCGVALGSPAFFMTGSMLMSFDFLVATLLDSFDGACEACDMAGMSEFGVCRRLGGGLLFLDWISERAA